MKADKNLVEYAVIDHLHLMVKDLFRSMSKADKEKRLHIKQEYGIYRLEVRGFAQLGGFDLLMLQAIIGMAGLDQKTIDVSPKGRQGRELREKLDLQHDSMFQKGLVVETTYRNLASQMGRSAPGSFMKAVNESLKNLGTTNFYIETINGRQMFGFNVISAVASDDNSFAVALNPFLAAAVMGERNFTKVFLTESRKMKTDAGRILHSKLSGLIDVGKERKFRIDTLVSYVWPDTANETTTRKRQSRLLGKVLPDLENAGWYAKPDNDMVRIRRPKPKPAPQQLSLFG